MNIDIYSADRKIQEMDSRTRVSSLLPTVQRAAALATDPHAAQALRDVKKWLDGEQVDLQNYCAQAGPASDAWNAAYYRDDRAEAAAGAALKAALLLACIASGSGDVTVSDCAQTAEEAFEDSFAERERRASDINKMFGWAVSITVDYDAV